MKQTALILGASGRFGCHAVQAFKLAGWNVRIFDRKRDDLSKATKGADIIVNGWNPPYPKWRKQVPILHDQVIQAARDTGATVIVPGNVYVFGADTPIPWGSASQHRAQNPLGRVRIDMEAAYRCAGVPVIVLRAGDFIDTKKSGNWFDQVLTKSLSKGIFSYPGRPDIPHAWAYLPDLCRAAVQLAEVRKTLPTYADISFPGYTLSGNEMVAVLREITAGPVRLKQMSWLPLYLARPFWRMAACLIEMRYLWDTPHWLDQSVFDELLPGFAPTPVEIALAEAIQASSIQDQIHPNQPMAAGS